MPILVVHGASAWKLLLVVMTLATYGVLRAVWRLVGRRARRRYARQLMSRAVASPAVGEIVLRGRLRGGAATTISSYAGLHAWDFGADHWLELQDGVRIELTGALRVMIGARGSLRRHLPTSLPGPLPFDLSMLGQRVRIEELADGDEAAVHGRLELQLDGGEPRFVMHGAHARTPIVATGCAPRRLAIESHRTKAVLVCGVAALVHYKVLCVVGDHALSAWRAQTAITELPELGDAAIAAAMPSSRDDFLDGLETKLQKDAKRVASRNSLLDAAVGLSGDACDLAWMQFRATRFETALETSRGCGDRDLRADILIALGRFEDAYAVGSTHEFEAVTSAIATRHWDAAAAAITDNPCASAYLRFVAGHADAFANPPATCRAVAALTLPVDEQRVVFDALLASKDLDARDIARDLEHVDVGVDDRYVWLDDDAEMPGFWLTGIVPAAARIQSPKAMAMFEATIGRTTWKTFRPVIDVSRSDDHGWCSERILDEARHGNGAGLAEYLERCGPGNFWETPRSRLVEAISAATTDRERIRRALREYRTDWFTMSSSLYRTVLELADYRDLSRLAGDTEEAAHWQAIITRFAALYENRETAIALYLFAAR